ncbi:MAG TPA: RNA-guided pseudouridylation complex pseudouridine synthase subunit Cbf5, partial [Methanothrix sp.]|nr:RNA-guided pseudouridylation complex pseudouridine synthase subunit Cbf5 [Methanothrix sp.]
MIHRPDRDRSSRKGQYSRQASSEARQNSSSSSGTSPPRGREESYPQILPSDRQRSALVKRKGKTDPTYGLPPEQRSLKQHISVGAINLDKTSGPTSHEVAAWVKRILEVDKAGHSGTLDPKVTGILPVLLEDATRIMETLLLAGKEYICLMRLHKPVPKKRIMEVCREFMGPIYQKPPLKSSVVKELRVRTIYYLDVLEIEEQHVLMRVGCEAGTYIRKLCFDMGLA